MSHRKKISIILFSLMLISLSSATSVVDFCVADLSLPGGPAGYPCKKPDEVTVNDFVYSGLNVSGNSSNPFKVGLTAAIDLTFPALNGLGLSMIRADLEVGGVVPIHAHRVSEIIFVVDGTVVSGFIDGENKAYYKTLNKGDVMVVPASLYHFAVNTGETPAFLVATWNSANPGIHTVATSIGSNDLPTDVIQKTTLLDADQIQKLKKLLGGTN